MARAFEFHMQAQVYILPLDEDVKERNMFATLSDLCREVEIGHFNASGLSATFLSCVKILAIAFGTKLFPLFGNPINIRTREVFHAGINCQRTDH